jgi:hypothetical protein
MVLIDNRNYFPLEIVISQIPILSLMLKRFFRKSKGSTFKFHLYRSLSEIEKDWDKNLPENHHLNSTNLHFLENNTSINGHYVLVKSGAETIGQIYLQKVVVPLNTLARGFQHIEKIKFLSNSIKNINCGLDFLVCGNIYRPNQEGYILQPEVQKEDVFKEFIHFLESEDKNLDFSGLLIKECCSPLSGIQKIKPIQQDVSMALNLSPAWLTIADYIGDLDKKYRKRFLKIQVAGTNLVKRELIECDLVNFKNQIFALYNEVYSTQDFKLTEIFEDYFINLKKALGDKLKVFGFFETDKLLAFTTHIYNENKQMEIHYIGLDYAFNKKYNLYFNILQFGLEHAINDKQKSLELGRTAQVAKASLGAKPTPRFNYIYFKKHVYSWSFQLFLRKTYKKIESEWEVRNPFTAKSILNQS